MSLKINFALLALFVCAGCDATYAPPVRAAAYGAPGRLDQGRVEFSASAGGVAVPQVVVAHVGYGVTDWFAVEAGANIAPGAWYTGFVGPRFSWVPHREDPFHFVSDFEAGFGGGVGGSLLDNAAPSKDCPDCDGRAFSDRAAYGGYQGLGLGYKMRWFTLFTRVRVEESIANNVPITVWPSAMVGLEFDVKRIVSFTVGGGYMGYHDSKDAVDGWFYQFGLTVFLDTDKRHRAH